MRRSLRTVLVAGLLASIAVVAHPPAAHACDYVPPLELSADVFTSAASLDDLNAFTGPVRVAYDEWLESHSWMGDQPPSAIIGAHRVTTVVYATPPAGDVFSGNAAVQVFDAVWGQTQAPDFEPMAIAFDTSSCAGEFEPVVLGESEWVIVAEPGSWYALSPSVDEYEDLDVALTRLFGEPVRPEQDDAAVERALDEILSYAAEDFDQPVTDIQRIGAVDEPALAPTATPAPVPTAAAQPPAEPEGSASTPAASEPSNSSTRTIVVGGAIVAALVAAAVWGVRRNRGASEPIL